MQKARQRQRQALTPAPGSSSAAAQVGPKQHRGEAAIGIQRAVSAFTVVVFAARVASGAATTRGPAQECQSNACWTDGRPTGACKIACCFSDPGVRHASVGAIVRGRLPASRLRASQSPARQNLRERADGQRRAAEISVEQQMVDTRLSRRFLALTSSNGAKVPRNTDAAASGVP